MIHGTPILHGLNFKHLDIKDFLALAFWLALAKVLKHQSTLIVCCISRLSSGHWRHTQSLYFLEKDLNAIFYFKNILIFYLFLCLFPSQQLSPPFEPKLMSFPLNSSCHGVILCPISYCLINTNSYNHSSDYWLYLFI